MNPALVKRVELLLKKVEFHPLDQFEYKFYVDILHGGVHLWAEYHDRDIYTRKLQLQLTRKWRITPAMTDSEIVQTAFKCCLTSFEHRCREAFKYKGARIFGPHFDVEDLVKLCKDGKEDAGGRK